MKTYLLTWPADLMEEEFIHCNRAKCKGHVLRKMCFRCCVVIIDIYT
jgi:hypothetical protein